MSNIRIKVKILKVGNLINYKKYKIKILHIDGSMLDMSTLPDPIMMRMEHLTKCGIFSILGNSVKKILYVGLVEIRE
jgi:hypothetical protein